MASVSTINLCIECETPVFPANLLVTPCWHIFDEAKLNEWFVTSITCPHRCETTNLAQRVKPFLKSLDIFKERLDAKFIQTTVAKNPEKKECSLTLRKLRSAYFISQAQRFMHPACWKRQKNNAEQKAPPRLSPVHIVYLQRDWPSWKETHPKQSKGWMVKVIASTVLTASFYAYVKNWRSYQNQDWTLFFLSIPAIAVIKTASLSFTLFKRVFVSPS